MSLRALVKKKKISLCLSDKPALYTERLKQDLPGDFSRMNNPNWLSLSA